MSSQEPFVFVVRRTVPELGIQPGEVVIVRPGHVRAVVVERTVPPDYDLILRVALQGTVSLCSRGHSLADLREAARSSTGSPRRRHLELCR